MYAPDPIVEAEREFLCKFAELGLSVARQVHRRLLETEDDRMTVDLAGAFNRSARTARLCLILAAKPERDRREAPPAETRAVAERASNDPPEHPARAGDDRAGDDSADDESEPLERLDDAEPEPLETDAVDRLETLEDLDGDPAALAEQACDELAGLAADFDVPIPLALRRGAEGRPAPRPVRAHRPAPRPRPPGHAMPESLPAQRPPRPSSA